MNIGVADMVTVPGGTFMMGSNRFYPDEGPRHEREVAPFALDRSLVTNAQFATFVAATGYVTIAEQALDPAEYPQLSEAERAPGSVVFRPTAGPVDLRDWRQWWHWQRGANWRHPDGPQSSIIGLDEMPVVQISYLDASAYAQWAGKRLPTETEFEFAAQDGRDDRDFAWGDERNPNGHVLANTWYGAFPYENIGANGWRGRSPVGAFPPNSAGFYDLIGNVWEWTSSYYTMSHADQAASFAADSGGACCAPAIASREPGSTVPRRVLKGGSHLCAPEYCLRYRPAARSPQAQDTATNHIGFRCALSL